MQARPGWAIGTMARCPATLTAARWLRLAGDELRGRVLTATTSVRGNSASFKRATSGRAKDVAEQVRRIQLWKDHPAWLPQ